MNQDDHELRTSFEALREGDRRAAPSFERMWQTAASDRRGRLSSTRMMRAAFVAVTLVIVLTVALVSTRREPLPIENLSRWRSPTASLMDMPSNPLISTVPTTTR